MASVSRYLEVLMDKNRGVAPKEKEYPMQENPDMLVGEVALRVGFNTPKYFSKCFKKEFGIFPKEYAEEQRRTR